MAKSLEKQLIEIISLVPGLVGLSNLDFTKKATILKEENWERGVSIESQSKGIIVKVAAIISMDVSAKVVSNEVAESVKNIMKNNKEKFGRVVFYIRGVK